LGTSFFFRVLSVFPSLDFLRVVCAVLCVADGGVHYIALAAMKYTADTTASEPRNSDSVSAYWLAYWVLVSALGISVFVSVAAISDLRSWLLRTSVQLHRAEVLIESIKKRHCGADGNSAMVHKDIQNYFIRSRFAFGKPHNHHADAARDNIVLAASPSLYYDAVTTDSVDNSFAKKTPVNSDEHGRGSECDLEAGLETSLTMAERRKPTSFDAFSCRSSDTKIVPYASQQHTQSDVLPGD
jgi:hypothetical protein